ncbi:MAG: DUF547 domain-containing protein [Spirochaetales bacterium]|nr:DUF547 domain-containing protein [Spirochaetales bacterium]
MSVGWRQALILLSLCGTLSCYRDMTLVRRLFYPAEMDMRGGPGPDTAGRATSYPLYARLLGRYVRDGFVDYGALKQEKTALDQVLAAMSAEKVDSLSKYEQIAFYINLYNAATLRLILDYPGIKSIHDIPAEKRWKDRRWNVQGKLLSLDDLEHEILRKEYRLPWVHFVLTCASQGCPVLRSSPYSGKGLQQQLQKQTEIFFARSDSYRLDRKKKILYLSELLDWYRGDLVSYSGSVLDFMMDYAPDSDRAFLREQRPRIGYLKYSWDLNGSW